MCRYKANASLLILVFAAANYITIILPVALTGFEYWSFTFSGGKHNSDILLRSKNTTYVVWQKSNGTDFLLTMNFILFTNQLYPLQNSSLGQLHIDGGVVSIVRSSARRLLLIYLSARRLCSSGYYPKYQNGAILSGF